MSKPGRNDPCPCGSGKKFKHCCVNKPPPPPLPLTPEQECRRLTAERDMKNDVYALDLHQRLGRKLGRKPTKNEWDRALEAERQQHSELIDALKDVRGGEMYAYAYEQTGFLVIDAKTRKHNPVLSAKWDAAIAAWKKANQFMHGALSHSEGNETVNSI
jgi:hypothetical protein